MHRGALHAPLAYTVATAVAAACPSPIGVPYEDGPVDRRDGPGGGMICEKMPVTTKDLYTGSHGAPGPAPYVPPPALPTLAPFATHVLSSTSAVDAHVKVRSSPTAR